MKIRCSETDSGFTNRPETETSDYNSLKDNSPEKQSTKFTRRFHHASDPEYEAPISLHYEYDLGGAELGKKETTMAPEKIFALMKKDLDWFKNSLAKHNIARF